ncbi:MAG: hypothetical protein STSR0009_04750 [Methanoregula sp.]
MDTIAPGKDRQKGVFTIQKIPDFRVVSRGKNPSDPIRPPTYPLEKIAKKRFFYVGDLII